MKTTIEYSTIKCRKDEFLAILSIDSPPANVFTKGLIEDLDIAFDHLSLDDSVRAILITSLNKTIFLSGGDLKSAVDCMKKGEIKAQLNYVQSIQKIIAKLEKMPKPTIASINGHALGGGCEFIMACDFRLMANDNKLQIGIPEIDLGFTPAVGGLYRISRKFGQQIALKMGFGFRLTAQEAFNIGLVDDLYPPDELLTKSIEFAKKMAELPTKAAALIKRVVIEGFDKKIEDVYKLELRCLEEALMTEDAKEGINAFLEKRKPIFKGK